MSAFDDWLDSFPEKESEDLEDECTYQAAKIVFNAGLEAAAKKADILAKSRDKYYDAGDTAIEIRALKGG